MIANGVTFTPTITDNQGNGTYANDVVRPDAAAATGTSAVIASKANVVSSGTFTAKFDTSVSTSDFTCCAIAFSGVLAASPLDVTASAFTENADQSSQVTGTTGVTAQADSVAIIALAVNNGVNVTSLAATGYTITASQPDGAGALTGAFGYKILSAIGAQSATWNYGATSGAAADDHAAGIAVYKGLVAAAGGTDGARLSEFRGQPMIRGPF
jgi:hypothetical protein